MSIKFSAIKKDLFEYHCLTDIHSNPISNDFSLDKNKLVWKEICEKEGTSSLWRDFFISSGQNHFNRLLFQLLLMNVLCRKVIYGVVHCSNLITELNSTENFSSNWAYDIVHEAEEAGVKILDNGFLRLDSPEHLFKVHNFQLFIDAMKVSSDVTTGGDFYSVKNINKVGSAMSKGEAPDLIKILEDDDIFASLMIGEDLDYNNYILIKSKKDISLLIKETEKRAEDFSYQFMKDYLKMKNVSEVNYFIRSLIKSIFPECFNFMK